MDGSSLSHNLASCCGTTDDFTAILFHLVLSSDQYFDIHKLYSSPIFMKFTAKITFNLNLQL